MKVLITSRSFGEISREPYEILEKAGIRAVKLEGSYDREKFAKELSDSDALIIGAHKLEEEAVRNAPKLKIVCKHGAGLDNIDLDMAKRYGITVTNVPGTNSNAVADLAFGLMLSVARGITGAACAVKNGNWGKYIGTDVCGKRLGLVGFGAIARNVARRARGFRMEVWAYDPYVTELPEEFADVKLKSFEELLPACDFLSFHVPLTDATRGLLSAEGFAKMKPGSIVINTSRGGVVDEEALLAALQSGRIAGAGLDVLSVESADTPLAALDNVVITPHIGMYSKEAISAVSLICAENAAAALTGGELKFVVSP